MGQHGLPSITQISIGIELQGKGSRMWKRNWSDGTILRWKCTVIVLNNQPHIWKGREIDEFIEGVKDDLLKNICSTDKLIKHCQFIEYLKQIGCKKIEGLPNVVPIITLRELDSLFALICQTLREEV